MPKPNLKSELFALCLHYADNRISIARAALDESQQAANEESKSTAGDKHDTSRAMMQIDVEQASKQLALAEKQKEELLRIDAKSSYDSVVAGSLVKTSAAVYFVSIAAGKLDLEDTTYFAVSISSPVIQALKGLKKGESIFFNGNEISISDVC